jgi:uncharacterized protein (TIGR02284 family)
MSTTTTSIASLLNSLLETCKDGQEGFRTAADGVQDADFKSLFVELSIQRQQFITELNALVASLGEQPEDNGSISAALHRGWMGLKAAISGGEVHSILAECERGEDAAVAEYRDALEHEDLPAEVRETIQRQYIGIQAAHDRVRDLRNRFGKS